MAFCPNCGSEVQGRFCAKCGSPVAAPAGPAPEPTPGPIGGGGGYVPPPPAAPPVAAQSGLADNIAAALCYLLGVLTGILFLVLEPYNRNRTIRFHAFQSIFVWIAAVALFIGLSIVGFALLAIPFIGAFISLLLHLGLGVGMLILWIMLMYKAYNNERWVLPIIGPLAEKQA
jgi:uncharacterized membrane protein